MKIIVRYGKPFPIARFRAFFAIGLLTMLLSLTAGAATFPVTNTNDAGPGSLRQAILNANAAGTGPNSIVFNVYGPILLQSSLPQITTNGLSIDGLNKIILSTSAGGDVAINFFQVTANNVTIKNFTLLNTGSACFFLAANTSGVTIQNIIANNLTGNYIDNVVFVNGASTNLTLRNITSRTGLQTCAGSNVGRPFYFVGGAQTNLVMDSIYLSTAGNASGCEGVKFQDASVNGFTFTNSSISGVSNGINLTNTGGPVETANNILINHVTIDSLFSGTGIGFYSNYTNTGITLKNTLIDMRVVTNTTDFGDYGIRFDNTVNGITLDSVQVKNVDIYSIWFNGADTNVSINHSSVSKPFVSAGTTMQEVRFESTVNTLSIKNTQLNCYVNGTSYNADYGLVFVTNVTGVTLDSLTITAADVDGIYVNAGVTNFTLNHSLFSKNYTGIDFLANAPHTNVSILNSSFLNGAQSGIRMNTTNAVEQFTLTGDTVAYNASSGIWPYGGTTATSINLSGNVIHDNGVYGVYMNNSPTNVVISQNSIYNNTTAGIGMDGSGNCSYTGPTKTPSILSSTSLGGGQYQLQLSIPAVSAGALYNVDIYANDAGTSATSGQYYVTTLANQPAGTSTQAISYNTGPGATGVGFWTATLRIPANTCGTSAFSGPMAMTVRGPAGVNSGILAWYRADLGASGVNWGDISGNANSMTVSGTPTLTTGLVNFNPAFYYNGLSAHLVPTTAGATGAYTLGGLGRLDGTQNARVFSSSTGNKLFGWHGGLENRLYIEGWVDNGNAITNYTKLYSFKRSTLPAAAYEFKGNGMSLLTGGATDAGAWTLTVGGGQGENSKVYVPEVFIYSRDITAAEMQKVESYMALKYGITLNNGATNYLATDGTVYWNTATNTGYNKRITGMGRDSLTMLYQKQSLSADTGMITLALGNAVDSSNAANPFTIAKDKSFLVVADNNGSTGMTTAVTGVNANQRMARVWTVQKTNWTDQLITLQVQNASMQNYLLISTDPAFGTISQELRLDAGGNITLNSSLLASGTYFTIGANIKGPNNVNSGVAMWLRADDGKSTGAQWNDYSGNGNGASQPVAASQPALIINAFNFNRGLRFDGITNQLTVPYSAALNGNVTVYTVYRQTTGNSYRSPITSRLNASLLGWNYYVNGNGREWWTGNGNWDVLTGGTYTVKSPEIGGFTATLGSGTGAKNIYVNGALTGSATSRSYLSNTNAPLWIGSTGGGNFWNGDIAEAIVYSRVLGTTQRQQVESYLALKYGITLNAGATNYLASDSNLIYWNTTRNAGYTTHITGIGRDSLTSLYQRQSLGVDTGYLTIALGTTVAVANETNTATITADKSFLVAGDNGGAKTFSSSLTAAGTAYLALARAWRVQKTNWTDQPLTLATDTTLPAPQYLIISTDPTFGTGDLVLPVTNRTITLNGSQLPDGVYFTFANLVRGPANITAGIGAWWRADIGGSGSSWPDYSGNGKTQTQTVAATQPTLQPAGINFNAALNFNYSNYMNSASLYGTGSIQNTTVFAITLPKPGSYNGLFEEATNSGSNIGAYAPYSDNNVYFYAPNSPYVISGAWGGTYGNPYLFTFTRQPAGTSMDVSVNNRSVASVTSTLNSYSGINAPFYVGTWTPGYNYNGQIAEMIVYNNNAAMTAAGRQKILSYLALKYGLTLNPAAPVDYLASDNTPFWGAVANASYYRHITGIGRDSISALYQKQSISADTSLITLALGDSVATSNTANVGTLTDRSFFVFGDNNASAVFLTPFAGSGGINMRMARVFKVQKTNWMDQDITLKVSGVTAKTWLLVSTDPNFATGATAYPFADSTIHINSSKLASGVYFTFATARKGPNAVSNGIVMWLRADDGSASGQQWNDYSGNGANAVQATPSGQPATDAQGLNFNYGLVFNGSTSNLQIPNSGIVNTFPFGNTDRTMIALGSKTGTAVGVSLGYGVYTTAAMSVLSVFNQQPYYWGYSADLPGTATGYPLSRPVILTGRHTAATGTNSFVDVNGVNNVSGNLTWNTYSTGTVSIGTSPGLNNYWNGPIGELIIYNRTLSATELQLVNSYLSIKYGVTFGAGTSSYLASDSTVYWDSAVNKLYPKRITGIGRDDSTQLYTKQSVSADTGFVTLSLGAAVALTNQLNTTPIPNNKSFFVFGDNGLSAVGLAASVSGSTHGVTVRYARVWKVQKTNWTDQPITLKIVPLGLNNYLLISTDPNFGSLTQELPVASDGTVTLSSSLLTNGIYFTYGAPLHSPGGMPGHTLWLRADLGTSATTDNTAISQWNDQSAFVNTVTQPVVVNQPLYRDNTTDDINFNPVLKFNGSNFLSGLSMLRTGTYNGAAAFVINSQVSPAATSIFNEPCTGGALNLHATWSDNTVYWDAPSTSNRVSFNPGNINNLVNLWSCTSNITLPSNKQAIYWNGVNMVNGNNTSTYTGTNNAFNIGNYAGAPGYNGRIPEIVIYTSALTPIQQQQVNSYLSLKYGITLNNGLSHYLSTDSTIRVWDTTVNAGYRHNIAGIGRDDLEALAQKQSRSLNAGVQPAIGLGEIDSVNSANAHTFTADRTYLVWGDDSTSTSFVTAVSGNATVNFRMTRVWKVQETGSVGNVQIAIPYTAFPNTKDANLIVSNDNIFDGADAFYPMTQVVYINGVKNYAATVNLSNGQYFSFATNVKAPGGVAGTTLWLRSDQGIVNNTDANPVNAWVDYGNQVNTVTQPIVVNQPLYRDNTTDDVNFNPVVKFNGSTSYMSGPSMLKTGTYTGEAAFSVNSQVVPSNVILYEPASGGYFSFETTSSNGNVYWNVPYSANYVSYNPGNINNQVNLWTGTNNVTLPSNRQMFYQNGVNTATGNGTATLTGTNTNFNVGQYTGATYNGRIPEIVMYTFALTLKQQQQVNSYLSLKYGITLNNGLSHYLSTDSTIKVWDTAVNVGYRHNIAGIGRDDVEALAQKQSRSINAGLQVAIGLGEIDSVNSANAHNFTADRTYLVWGDDSTTTSFLTPVTGNATVNFRMTRLWKVQETGSAGNVQIAIPYNTFPNAQSATLIVSNDAVLDAADAFYPMTQVVYINGVKNYAATVNLNSGQYFSFASNLKAPGGVPGTSLWLRPDQGTSSTTDNTAISEWLDAASQLNHATQPLVTNQPLYRNNATDNVNFNPIVKFTAANSQFMSLDITKLPTGTIARTLIGMGKMNPLSSGQGYLIGWGTIANSQLSALAYVPASYGYYVGYNNDMITAANFWQTNTFNDMFFTWAGGASGNAALYSKTKQVIAPSARAWSTGTTDARIGSIASGGAYWDGAMGDVIVYPYALTAAQQQQVESYLAVKYGYTIDQTAATNYLASDGTTVTWDATANLTYKNRITGIGRDDLTVLNQLQSRNLDTTTAAMVTIGLGRIAANNLSNTGSFSADRNFLLWGDDSGSITFQTPLTGNPSVNFRMGRTWKVQKTGSVGSVEVAFPYDVLPNPVQSFLVVSNDAVFDASDTYIPLYNITVNGKSHWAAPVNFTSGQYFTIAAFVKSPGGVGMTSLWLRPDKGILNNTDGGAVDVWVDFANQVNTARQPNILNQPAYRNNVLDNVNFNPVVKFTAANSHFMNLDITKLPVGTTARTLIGMGRMNPLPSGNGYLIDWGAAAGSQLSSLAYVSPGYGDFESYGNSFTTAANFWQANVFNELFGTWAGNGGNASIYSKMLQVAAPVAKGWNTGTTDARIGGTFWSTEYWNGNIGDLIVFNRELTVNERQRVETYLAMRYGYTLDQTTPVNYLSTVSTTVWNATANRTYKYNIAGIGRDDIEGLDQRQSRSINTGSIVTIAMGTVASDNPSNGNPFSSDTSYLVWGSDSTVLTTMTTNLPAGFSNAKRMSQQWKVALTNFSNPSQPLTIAFDLNGVSYTDTGSANLVLLVDPDGSGNFATSTVQTINSTSYNGTTKTVSFAGITSLTDGAVFTLAFRRNLLNLNAKVYLQGAWNGSSMDTALKAGGLLPATDPYGLNTTPKVSPNSATVPVVDWVRVELRDPVTPTTVIASRAAFVLADGTIVDTNYTQPLSFPVAAGQYKVVIRHRNHLGIMSASAIDFSSGSGTADFTNGTTPTYTHTNAAQANLGGGISGMWGGDANGDGKVYYTSSGNDPDWILNNPLGGDPNGYVIAYSTGDVNMDGQVYYISTGDDADWILYNPLGNDPNGYVEAQLP
jgi:hypothetical protein